MAEISTYTTDASVAAKWLFQDEPEAQQANDLLSDFLRGRANVIGPPHFGVEVLSIVRSKVLKREIASQLGQRHIRAFAALRVPIMNPEGLISLAYDYAIRYTISVHDAVYVALAQIEQAPLITADNHLLHALGTRFSLALPLEHYVSR